MNALDQAIADIEDLRRRVAALELREAETKPNAPRRYSSGSMPAPPPEAQAAFQSATDKLSPKR